MMQELERQVRRGLQRAAEKLPDTPHTVKASSRTVPSTFRGPLLAFAAMTIMVVVLGGASLLLLGGPDSIYGRSGANVDDSLAENEAATVGTAGVGAAGDGSTSICDSEVTRATLYLGEPSAAPIREAARLIYSKPAQVSPVDLAESFASEALVGSGCEGLITATSTAGPADIRATSLVEVLPPAVAAEMHLTVESMKRDGLIGVIAVQGETRFEVIGSNRAPVLRVTSLPDSASTITVRFRKGSDVWELSGEVIRNTEIPLIVPLGETDRFPDSQPEWVLFTVGNDLYGVLDAGGALIP